MEGQAVLFENCLSVASDQLELILVRMDPADGEYELFALPVRIEDLAAVGATYQEKITVRLDGAMGQDTAEQPLGQIGVRIGVSETEGWPKAGQLPGESVLFEADEQDKGEVEGMEVPDLQLSIEGPALVEQSKRCPVAWAGKEKVHVVLRKHRHLVIVDQPRATVGDDRVGACGGDQQGSPGDVQ
jgi:hypothetical protein